MNLLASLKHPIRNPDDHEAGQSHWGPNSEGRGHLGRKQGSSSKSTSLLIIWEEEMRAAIEIPFRVMAPEEELMGGFVFSSTVPAEGVSADAGHMGAALGALDHLVAVRAGAGLSGQEELVQLLFQGQILLGVDLLELAEILLGQHEDLVAEVAGNWAGEGGDVLDPNNSRAELILAAEDPVPRLHLAQIRIDRPGGAYQGGEEAHYHRVGELLLADEAGGALEALVVMETLLKVLAGAPDAERVPMPAGHVAEIASVFIKADAAAPGLGASTGIRLA